MNSKYQHMESYLWGESRVFEVPPLHLAGYTEEEWILSGCQVAVKRSFAHPWSVINRHRSNSGVHSPEVYRSPWFSLWDISLWVWASTPPLIQCRFGIHCLPPTTIPLSTTYLQIFIEITSLPWVPLSLLNLYHFSSAFTISLVSSWFGEIKLV